MPGRPKLRAAIAAIESIGGEDAVFERIAAGETFVGIARELGIGQYTIYSWLNRSPGREERRAKYAEAQKHAADAHVDIGLDVVEKSLHADSNVEVQAARNIAGYRQWMAEKMNRAKYGKETAQLNLNIGSLHLDALRELGGEASQLIEDTEVELLPSGDGEDDEIEQLL